MVDLLSKAFDMEELQIIEDSLRVDMREDDAVSAILRSVGRAGLKYVDKSHQDKEHSNDIFDEIPVDSKTFFREFVNEPNYPIQQAAVDAIFGCDANKWDNTYNEFILLWGMGSGKDHTSGKILTYAAYWIRCLKEPQKYFRLGRGTSLDLANMCINARLAKNVFFEDFKNTVCNTMIPGTKRNWFEAHGIDIREGKDVRGNEIDFGNGLVAHSLNSETQSDIGMNPLMVVFDEIGGFDPDDAEKLYSYSRKTQASRFANTGSHKRLLLSFKRSDNDYMMIRYKESIKEAKVYRSKAKTWEVNKAVKKSDLADEYASDPEGAKRVYECEGELQEGTYIRHRKSIRHCISDKWKNPIRGDLHRIYNIHDIRFRKWFRGKPGKKYFVHIDLATGKDGNDCAGLGLIHMEKMSIHFDHEYVAELLKDDVDITKFMGVEHYGIVCDLGIQLKARPGKEIQFNSIIDFVVNLKTKYGFEIELATYDGFSSIGERQRMKERGIESDLLSVDRTTEAYDTLKSLVYTGLFKSYYNPILVRELEELIYEADAKGNYTRRKINHPHISIRRSREEGNRRGSKDIADGVAGATRSCIDRYKEYFSFGFLNVGDRTDPIPHPKDVEEKQMKAMQDAERERFGRIITSVNSQDERFNSLVRSF